MSDNPPKPPLRRSDEFDRDTSADIEAVQAEPPPDDEGQRTRRFMAQPAEPDAPPPPPAQTDEPPSNRTGKMPALKSFAPPPPKTVIVPPAPDEGGKTSRFVPMTEPPPADAVDYGERTARFTPPSPQAPPPPPPPAPAAEPEVQRTARFQPLAEPPPPAPPSPAAGAEFGERTARFVPPPPKPPESAPPKPAAEPEVQKTARFVPMTEPPPEPPPEPPAPEGAAQKTSRFIPVDSPAEGSAQATARYKTTDQADEEKRKVAQARESYLEAAQRKLDVRRAASQQPPTQESEPADAEPSTGLVARAGVGLEEAPLRDASALIEKDARAGTPVISAELLPGEPPAEEPERPTSLKLDEEPGTEDLPPVKHATSILTRVNPKLAFMTTGAALGALAGAAAILLAPGFSLPFIHPSITPKFSPITSAEPEDAKAVWARRGGYFLGVTKDRLVAARLVGRDLKVVGQSALDEAEAKTVEAQALALGTVIGEEELGNLHVAYSHEGATRWRKLSPPEGAPARPALADAPTDGRKGLEEGSREAYAPSLMENWSRASGERLLLSLRKARGADSLRTLDPASAEAGHEAQLGGGLIAPPVVYYDPEARETMILAVSSNKDECDAALLKDGDGALQSVATLRLGKAQAPEFALTRARIAGGRGWLLARKDGSCAVIRLKGQTLELAGEELLQADAEDQNAPVVATFPSPDQPSEDWALIVDPSAAAKARLVRLTAHGPVDIARIALPRTRPDMAVCDVNGDGYWDVIGLGPVESQNQSALWILDGRTFSVLKPSSGAALPAVKTEIVWTAEGTATGGELRAAWFARDGKPSGLAFTLQGQAWQWLAADRPWRAGERPFLASTAPGAAPAPAGGRP